MPQGTQLKPGECIIPRINRYFFTLSSEVAPSGDFIANSTVFSALPSNTRVSRIAPMSFSDS